MRVAHWHHGAEESTPAAAGVSAGGRAVLGVGPGARGRGGRGWGSSGQARLELRRRVGSCLLILHSASACHVPGACSGRLFVDVPQVAAWVMVKVDPGRPPKTGGACEHLSLTMRSIDRREKATFSWSVPGYYPNAQRDSPAACLCAQRVLFRFRRRV